MSPDARWKRKEREKCHELGGKRRGPVEVGAIGRSDCVCPDGRTPLPLVSVEIKNYRTLQWLDRDWQQTVRNAIAEDRIPVLAVCEAGRNPQERVQMEWAGFVRLYHLALLGLAVEEQSAVAA